jgi:hypothetical protein
MHVVWTVQPWGFESSLDVTLCLTAIGRTVVSSPDHDEGTTSEATRLKHTVTSQDIFILSSTNTAVLAGAVVLRDSQLCLTVSAAVLFSALPGHKSCEIMKKETCFKKVFWFACFREFEKKTCFKKVFWFVCFRILKKRACFKKVFWCACFRNF